MKKITIIVLTIIMTISFGSAASAAFLTFDIDFWTDGTNPVNNYSKNNPTVYDTNQTITLQPSEKVWVDIYFSTDAEITAGSYDLQFNSTSLKALEGRGAETPWVLENYEMDIPGSVKYQDVVFPPGDFVTGNDIFFGSILLHCTGISEDELRLENYLGFITIDSENVPIIPSVNLGTISQVPIPGAIWLLCSGLVGLAGMRHRKKN